MKLDHLAVAVADLEASPPTTSGVPTGSGGRSALRGQLPRVGARSQERRLVPPREEGALTMSAAKAITVNARAAPSSR
jgi:hypothetical protein